MWPALLHCRSGDVYLEKRRPAEKGYCRLPQFHRLSSILVDAGDIAINFVLPCHCQPERIVEMGNGGVWFHPGIMLGELEESEDLR